MWASAPHSLLLISSESNSPFNTPVFFFRDVDVLFHETFESRLSLSSAGVHGAVDGVLVAVDRGPFPPAQYPVHAHDQRREQQHAQGRGGIRVRRATRARRWRRW